jgi:hypothetical protein
VQEALSEEEMGFGGEPSAHATLQKGEGCVAHLNPKPRETYTLNEDSRARELGGSRQRAWPRGDFSPCRNGHDFSPCLAGHQASADQPTKIPLGFCLGSTLER